MYPDQEGRWDGTPDVVHGRRVYPQNIKARSPEEFRKIVGILPGDKYVHSEHGDVVTVAHQVKTAPGHHGTRRTHTMVIGSSTNKKIKAKQRISLNSDKWRKVIIGESIMEDIITNEDGSILDENYTPKPPKTRHIPIALEKLVKGRVKTHIDKLNAQERAAGSNKIHAVRYHYIGPRTQSPRKFPTRPASTSRANAHSFAVGHYVKTQHHSNRDYKGTLQGYIHSEDLGVHQHRNKVVKESLVNQPPGAKYENDYAYNGDQSHTPEYKEKMKALAKKQNARIQKIDDKEFLKQHAKTDPIKKLKESNEVPLLNEHWWRHTAPLDESSVPKKKHDAMTQQGFKLLGSPKTKAKGEKEDTTYHVYIKGNKRSIVRARGGKEVKEQTARSRNNERVVSRSYKVGKVRSISFNRQLEKTADAGHDINWDRYSHGPLHHRYDILAPEYIHADIRKQFTKR